jgi:hypothetical protein
MAVQESLIDTSGVKKRAKKNTETKWAAFAQKVNSDEGILILESSQKNLKIKLSNLSYEYEVKVILKGKTYQPKIQRSFEFVDASQIEDKESSLTPDQKSDI